MNNWIEIIYAHLKHLPRGWKWQHGQSNQQIGDGQTDDEKVGDTTQFVRTVNGRND